MILFPHTMLQFLSELLRKHCLAKHQKWPWSFCTGEHSCIPWGRYVSFCISLRTNYACQYSLQHWLGYIGKCETNVHINPHATVFSQGQNDHLMHLSNNVPQSMGYSYVQNRKSAVTGHSNGHHQHQYIRWRHRITFRGQQTSYRSSNVSYTCTKGFQL